jgi:hypothetical protein
LCEETVEILRIKRPLAGGKRRKFVCDNESQVRYDKETLLRRGALAVDLQHLRYAVAAVEHGSFRRAAEVLQLRQSTLSRCVRQLEQLVGMELFERSSGGVRATEAGRNFLRVARSILEEVDSLVTMAHRTGRGEAGRLTVGFYLRSPPEICARR